MDKKEVFNGLQKLRAYFVSKIKKREFDAFLIADTLQIVIDGESFIFQKSFLDGFFDQIRGLSLDTSNPNIQKVLEETQNAKPKRLL